MMKKKVWHEFYWRKNHCGGCCDCDGGDYNDDMDEDFLAADNAVVNDEYPPVFRIKASFHVFVAVDDDDDIAWECESEMPCDDEEVSKCCCLLH